MGSVFVRSVNKIVPCSTPGTSFINQFWWNWDPVQVVMDCLTLLQDALLQYTRQTAALSIKGLLLLIFHYYSLPFTPSGGDTGINTMSASRTQLLKII